MPDQYAPEFSAIFQQLLAGHTPLLIHCEAGKDRSGLAAALILTALGVPRAQVMRDYELSNRYVTVTELEQNPADRALLTHLPPATASVLAGVDPAYLNAAFQSIDQQYGSVDAYLDKALAVGPAQQAQLRSMLLE